MQLNHEQISSQRSKYVMLEANVASNLRSQVERHKMIR